MSMMSRVLIASSRADPQPENPGLNYNVFDGIVVNRYPVKNPTRANRTDCFSDLVEGDNHSLVIQHITIIGGEDCPR